MGELMSGKAGLVTGAASGIGRACAVRFAPEGAAVVVADLSRPGEGGEQTVEMIRAAGGQAEFFACDVARAEDDVALVARVVEQLRPARLRAQQRRHRRACACSPTPRTRTSTA